MGGADSTITIPSYSISLATGGNLKTRLMAGSVMISMRYQDDLSGTRFGYMQMYAPDPFVQGSSVSHFTTAANPNLLMEPAATNVFNTVDLTTDLFQDIGWVLNTPTPNVAPGVNTPIISGVEDAAVIPLTGVSFADSDAGTLPLMVTLVGEGVGITPAASGSIPGVTITGPVGNRTWIGSAAALNNAISNGWLGYTPPANLNGTVTIGIEVHDMGASGTGGDRSYSSALNFEIAAVNDAPTITAPPVISVGGDFPAALTGISFDDVDGGEATIVLSVPSGTLSASSRGDVFVSGTPTRLEISGPFYSVNSYIALNSIGYVAAPVPSRDVPLTISINDQGNTGSGGALSATASLTLRIGTPANPIFRNSFE
jgi:hypothetical protein